MPSEPLEPTSTRVAIVIVNWNGRDDTLACLDSLRGDVYSDKRIIVVDNGSSDDSVSAIREAHPDVTLIGTGANLGFTGGNNVGIRRALAGGCGWVFLLNNDTTVEPDAVSRLVEAARADPRRGMLTPVIHYCDFPDKAWFAGSELDAARGVAVHDNKRVPELDEAPCEIPWASGCVMLMPADVARRVKGFDDRYFLNWEDVDLCLRVRRVGRAIVLVPTARIYHKVGRSLDSAGESSGSPVGLYYARRNNLLLARLHAPRRVRTLAVARLVLGYARQDAREIRRGVARRAPAAAASGHGAGRGRPPAAPLRAVAQAGVRACELRANHQKLRTRFRLRFVSLLGGVATEE